MITQPTLLAQQRAILSQLGITLWAGKSTPILTLNLHNPPVSTNQPITPAQASEALAVLSERFAIKKDTAQVADTPNQVQINAPDDTQTTQSEQEQTNQSAEPIAPTTNNNAHIRYHLQAIRYQNWLLLADVPQMNADAKAVWLSLNQALKRHAEQNRGVFASRQLQFPFDGIDEQAGNVVQLANSSFLGFVFSMTKADNRVKVCLLTPLPDFLNVNFATVVDFGVSQMAVEANLKKQFWQFLHANP